MKINKKEIRKKMAADFDRCSKPDWAEGGEEPVTKRNYEAALAMLELLPDDFPPPFVYPDYDGSFCFEWNGKGRCDAIYQDENENWFYCSSEKDQAHAIPEGKFPATVTELIKKIK